MVRLVSRYDNRLRVPSGALDFSDQLEMGGAPPPGFYRVDARPIGLNGPLYGKFFHCVPGPFMMALPPGDYDVAIYKGIEYISVQEKFNIKPGETTNLSVQMKRWVHMAKRGWYSGDDHVHASVMNDKDAGQIMTFAKATDTNVANLLCMGDHRRIWFQQRGYGPAFRVGEGDFILVPGQEGPRYFMGHAIGLNLKRMVRDPDRYLLNEWVADTIHADGGLYGQAHLGHELFDVDRDLTMQVVRGKSDFGEILQFNHLGTNLYYQYLNLGFKLTASAGSDTPYGGSIGDERVYANVGKSKIPFLKKKFTVDDWFEAVRRGNTFVTDGPMIDFQVDNAGPGQEIAIDKKQTLRIRAKAWGLANASAPKKLAIISHGKTIKEVTSDEPTQDTLEVEFEFEVEHGTWIAVHAFGHDGSQGHTTPVYIVRDGFRFWDVGQVPDLIAKRYAVLDTLEKALLDHQQQKAEGTLEPLSHFGMGLADQADEVLKSIEEVRLDYKNLQKIYQQELKQRGKENKEIL